MGPTFSKLMTKQTNTSSTPETLIPQFTVEDMEFDATVISSETKETELKTDILPLAIEQVTEPAVEDKSAPVPAVESAPVPVPVVESVVESVIEALIEPLLKPINQEAELVLQPETLIVDVVDKVKEELVVTEEESIIREEPEKKEEPERKEKREKRKKLRKNSL